MAAPKMERTRYTGIYRRGNRYVIVWQHHGRQHKEYFATLVEAREAKGRRTAGDRRKVERVRFDDYATRWIDNYRGRTSRGFSETTRVEYRRDVDNRLIPYFRGYRLDEIDAGDVKEWFGWLESRGDSATAIRKAKATLSALMGDAVEERKARFNPVAGVRYVPRIEPPPKAKPRGLTVAELERFMAAVRPEWRLLFALLAHTGVRIGEGLGLRWQHVHLGDDPHVDVREQVYRGERRHRPKSHHGVRSIPLSPDMAVALDRRRRDAEYAGEGDPVFASTTGTPLDYSAFYKRVFIPARDASGIEWPKGSAFHMFRRTAGSLLHANNKTGRQLADWLGHHDPAFTIRTYVGQMDDGLGDATFLDELIPVEGGQGVGKAPPANSGNGTAPESTESCLNGEQPQPSANEGPSS
jgi:integrase